MKLHPTTIRKMEEGAVAYAAFDRSDPFAYNRAMSHAHNGISGVRVDEGDNKVPAFYTAERYMEKRTLPEGQQFSNGENTYYAEAYKNAQRP